MDSFFLVFGIDRLDTIQKNHVKFLFFTIFFFVRFNNQPIGVFIIIMIL